ncbi:Hypothetical predicted protein [Paramuricea clavata]|uniref:Uncharacterized protein n=1 Tax=Paramuricea clavata TaxID=317549 RepID=A0A6S7HCD3_PARCT|nr:Hypothetical predicted protein [Paramuricea clavata]
MAYTELQGLFTSVLDTDFLMSFDVVITESSSENQSVSLEIFYELPSPSYLSSGEVLLSPLVVVGNMSEEETELRLTFPFLRDLPEDADFMAKWIRFYGGSSGDDVPMWQDIRTAEELDAFMVEIQQNYAKLHTQQNVSFCIVGSRDEPAVLYDYGTELEGEAYGDYTYTYEEYAAYYGTYDTANYGENYYTENNDGESNVTENNVAENNVAENNTADNFVTENVGASADSSDSPGTNVTLASASAALEKALQSPIPRPALGLPAPDVPTTQRPARPHPSPFDNVPLEKETKKKLKVKKVWKSSKSKKKDKDK